MDVNACKCMYILPVHTLPAHRSAASPRIETGQEEGADLDLQNHSAKLMSSWYLLLLVWKEIETLQFLRNILPSFNIQAGSGIVPRFDNRPTSPSRTWSMQILVEPHSSQTTQKGITWFELITISSFVCEIWSCQQKISVACSKKKNSGFFQTVLTKSSFTCILQECVESTASSRGGNWMEQRFLSWERLWLKENQRNGLSATNSSRWIGFCQWCCWISRLRTTCAFFATHLAGCVGLCASLGPWIHFIFSSVFWMLVDACPYDLWISYGGFLSWTCDLGGWIPTHFQETRQSPRGFSQQVLCRTRGNPTNRRREEGAAALEAGLWHNDFWTWFLTIELTYNIL